MNIHTLDCNIIWLSNSEELFYIGGKNVSCIDIGGQYRVKNDADFEESTEYWSTRRVHTKAVQHCTALLQHSWLKAKYFLFLSLKRFSYDLQKNKNRVSVVLIGSAKTLVPLTISWIWFVGRTRFCTQLTMFRFNSLRRTATVYKSFVTGQTNS